MSRSGLSCRAVLVLGLLMGGGLLGIAQEAPKAKPEPAAEAKPATEAKSGPEAEVRGFVSKYMEAFNAHKAADAAAMWSKSGVHVDHGTGDRAEGREAIQADLEAAFKAAPTLRLSGTANHVRLIRPDIVSIEGVAVTTEAGSDPSSSAFTALLVKEDGQWKVEQIEESPLPTPETAADALRELEWQVGDWTDQSEGVRVDMKVRWSPTQNYLLRQFTIVRDGEAEDRTGTQIIGWDPRAKHIRSWIFDADGSFGDGVWSKIGDDWYVKASQTLADGRAASGTYVIGRPDENTITVHLIGHEVEGEPVASPDPVTLVRVESREQPNEAPKPATSAPAQPGTPGTPKPAPATPKPATPPKPAAPRN